MMSYSIKNGYISGAVIIAITTNGQPASKRAVAAFSGSSPPIMFTFSLLSIEQYRWLKTTFKMWQHYIYPRWRRRGVRLEGVRRD